MNLMNLLKDHNLLEEANLKNLYSKAVSETPQMARRGEQIQSKKNGVRYYGLSEDGTWNFKVRSQSVPGGFYYIYIEAPDMLKFGDLVENGEQFTVQDLAKLLTMNSFRVHCNDPSFLYYAFQYMATQGNYEIEPETRAPKRNNTTLKGSMCKHLIGTVKSIFYDNSMREQLTSDINNYLRMLVGLDYEDYQQQKHSNQIKRQNRAVKWKNNPSDYMNDYFARQAKNHPFLDDHDIKKSLKKEMRRFIKAKPSSSVDDFLRDYFGMTKKAFSEDMGLPENNVDDYFNEIGWDVQHEKLEAKNNSSEPEQIEDLPTKDQTNDSSVEEQKDITKANIITKDSEQLTETHNIPSETKLRMKEKIEEAYHDYFKRKNLSITTISDERLKGLYNSAVYNLSKRTRDDFYKELLINPDLAEEYKKYSDSKFTESENNEYYTIEESHEKYIEYLEGHIKNVQAIMNWIIEHFIDDTEPEFIKQHKDALLQAARYHDKSKYEDEEFFPYLHHFYPTCKEDEMKTEEFEQACRHHIKSNPHHWDFWIDDNGNYIRDIEENDVMYKVHTYERICDWLSMTAQHNEYKSDWYDINKDSIKMPDWAHKLVQNIYKQVPDDYYTFLPFNGTRGEKDK